jgi:hypothetical protein
MCQRKNIIIFSASMIFKNHLHPWITLIEFLMRFIAKKQKISTIRNGDAFASIIR